MFFKKTKLEKLADFGQSIWLDSIDRAMLKNGKLKDLIKQGLCGLTSNPTIFEQAIGKHNEYDNQIVELKNQGKSTFEIYDELTTTDIRDAADLFEGLYEKTKGEDGFVSLEINPQLGRKVDEQIKEGLRLFEKVNRPNLMIKVPATREGLKVAQELIAQGVNVNITLIFSYEQYCETIGAYLNGLKRRLQEKLDISHIRSVASVFISRVDTLVDKIIEDKIALETSQTKLDRMRVLLGTAAVSNTRIIYQKFLHVFSGKEFTEFSKRGANLQRPLWGSTSTKNPNYSDIKYVKEFIAKYTVNTVPEKTLQAFLDHGEIKEAFARFPEGAAKENIYHLEDLTGVKIKDICERLLNEGLGAFEKSFVFLLETIEKKAGQLSVA